MEPGRARTPRMIVAQFDSIRCQRIYKKLMPDVLRSLETFLSSGNKDAWFTVFLATFLLLHQVACSSEDRYRHVRESENIDSRVRVYWRTWRQSLTDGLQETRYGAMNHPLTAWIEELHRGAAMLLVRWQYYKRCDLMNLDWEDSTKPPLVSLEPHQATFMRSIVGLLKQKCEYLLVISGSRETDDTDAGSVPLIPATPAEGCWEHELFWVSKMFISQPSPKVDWTPPEIFSRAKPSVGRN